MTKKERRIIDALMSLGGEASSAAIHRRMVEQSRWGDTFLGAILTALPYPELIKMELKGILYSHLGDATAERGWRKSKIYRIAGAI